MDRLKISLRRQARSSGWSANAPVKHAGVSRHSCRADDGMTKAEAWTKNTEQFRLNAEFLHDSRRRST